MFEASNILSPETLEMIGDVWADPQVTLGMKITGVVLGFFVALMTVSKTARASFRATHATMMGFAHIFTRMFAKDPHIKNLLYALEDPDLQVEGKLKVDPLIKLKTCRGLVAVLVCPCGEFLKDQTLLMIGQENAWPDLTDKERKLIYKKVISSYKRALERDRLERRALRSVAIEYLPGECNEENTHSAKVEAAARACNSGNVPILNKFNPASKKRA